MGPDMLYMAGKNFPLEREYVLLQFTMNQPMKNFEKCFFQQSQEKSTLYQYFKNQDGGA